MTRKKCIDCRKVIASKAIICANCGTNQKTGFRLMDKKHSLVKHLFTTSLKHAIVTTLKYIFVMLLFGLAVVNFCYPNLYKKTTEQVQRQITVLTSKQRQKAIDQQAQTTVTKPSKVYDEIKVFPLYFITNEDTDKYRLRITKSHGSSSHDNKSLTRIGINTSVYVPETMKAPLRIKIYSGTQEKGKYKLVYDQCQSPQLQNPNAKSAFLRAKRRLELKWAQKNISESLKKEILESRRKYSEKIFQSIEKSFCAIFSFEDEFDTLEKRRVYYRIVLCKQNGEMIKEGTPIRHFSKIAVPWKRNSPKPKNHYGPLYSDHFSRLPSKDRDIIFPQFNQSNRRALKFAFAEKGAFEIKSFSIDGIEYEPVFRRDRDKKCDCVFNHRDSKTYKIIEDFKKTYYSSVMYLDYPFGGQAKLKFKYKTPKGDFKDADFSFYLPPPPPVFKLEEYPEENGIKISWDNIDKGLDKSNFYEPPELIVKASQESKNFPMYQINSYIDKNVFRGEPLNYQVSFSSCIFKLPIWSSKNEVKIRPCRFRIENPFLQRGKNITLPELSEQSRHPVRIELTGNTLCYENTGISACKLLEAVIGRINKENDMVLYDRESRDYIIDEKYFALSDSLKKQFLMKEADYAIHVRDYSRQDGNGVQLWLFKKKITKYSYSKSTTYWKIAEIAINSNAENVAEAVEKLISKIRGTLIFTSCPDKRIKNIKPKNIICPSFRPVNQKFVLWNYKAVCESLFLMLNEKSKNIKILSQEDWDQIFNERILAHGEGHNYINNPIREVLLTGRSWRNDKAKAFYIQACDAFTGEVLESRIFTGKSQEIASAMAQWADGLKLSNDIKNDFQFSEFYRDREEKLLSRSWYPNTQDLLKNFGPCIKTQKSWSGQRTINFMRTQRHKSKSTDLTDENFYAFVKRQWKDGFRTKAVSMLEEKWNEAKTIETGMLLSEYYNGLSRYQDTLDVYDTLVQKDGCPKAVFDNYNMVRRKAKASPALIQQPAKAATKKVEPPKNANVAKLDRLAAVQKANRNSMDYGATWVNYFNNTIEHIPRKHIEYKESLEKYYFVDRDVIYPEWAPGDPCRTSKLILAYQKPLFSYAVKDPDTQNYGIWLQAYRYASKNSYPLEHFFSDWRYLSGKKHEESSSTTYYKADLFKPMIFLLEGAWNSTDPFSLKSLDKRTIYTRLGYFFDLYRENQCLLDNIYHYSQVRAFFELKKNPQLQFPDFKYVKDSRTATAKLRTAKELINFLAEKALDPWKFRDIPPGHCKYGELSLIELLAIDYAARHNGSNKMLKTLSEIYAYQIPLTIKDCHKAWLRDDFLIYKAYQKDQQAIRILKKKLLAEKHKWQPKDEKIADYIYLLGQSGLVELIKLIKPYKELEISTLRWLPAEILKEICGNYNYLIFGTRNDRAAQKFFFNSYCEELVNQYFGKPTAEAYQDWRQEHLKQVNAFKEKQVQ